MEITTKFNNGDKVWRGYTNWGPSGERICEECNGAGRLKIEGKALTIGCPNRCYGGKFSTYSFVPLAEQLTIGQVGVTIADSPGQPGASSFSNFGPQHKREESYMAIETGVVSGSIYYVEDLFATEAEALERAKVRVAEAIEFRRQEDEKLERDRRMAALQLQQAEETEDV